MMLLMIPLSLLAVYCCCLVRLSESVLWPAGSYGIPKAASGCPSADGFQWLIGRRYQDTEDNNPSNHKSQQFHLDATVDSKRGILRSFCMKTDTSTDIRRSSWPPGKYCIYKKGGSCPPNLTSGFIKWDDEDNNNLNNKTGTLPDGVYNHNTEIEFCCRTDGDKNDPINLPTLKPFFLLAYDAAECQQVKWATVNVEWIRFDNEDNDNADGKGGSYPHGAGINDHTIHYCYYQGCNKTLTGVSGLFNSPNHPGKYPDGQYCSWRITVSPAQQIHLKFTNFSLQSQNNTDSVSVYDGENATGKVLGVFYGGHPPPGKGVYSSSNYMFVIFKSDTNDSYAGFNASYKAIMCAKNSRLTSVSSNSAMPRTTSSCIYPTASTDTLFADQIIASSRIQVAMTSSVFSNVSEAAESVLWPAGSFGLPKAASGCPSADGFQWLIGRRYQDTEDNNPNNHKSQQFHLDATVDSKRGILRSFCMKTDTSTDIRRSSWPPGKYCIYKKGGSCPPNLTSGFIKWDDEDNNNLNNKTGTLPDGVYDRNTEIKFCCRTDGDKNDPITLPTLKPFFLLAYDSAECQQVKWAIVSVEWIRFDNEEDDNADGKGGAYPHGAGINDHTIHYCYYQGCNKVLTKESGTFHSPNYPSKYPDGQHCSWRITVSPAKQIHLTFTNFSLQREIGTDVLSVYDGENATGEVLGVFHGGQPPPNEGIYSSSNDMFVIFKSDRNDSYTGFNASYKAVNCSVDRCSTVAVSTSRVTETPSSPVVYFSGSLSLDMRPTLSTELPVTSHISMPAIESSPTTLVPLPSVTEYASSISSRVIASSKTQQLMTSPVVGPLVQTKDCNKTLTGPSGSFHSPNFPRSYPNGLLCSWRITVSPAQKIQLTFTNFSLQSENNTDIVFVHDGANATGEMLGVFYGERPPPKQGIQSSSNHMFVILKSVKNDTYAGFMATYRAFNCSDNECSFPVESPSSRVTSVKLSPFLQRTQSKTVPMMTSFYPYPIVTSYIKPQVTSPYTELTSREPTEPTEPTEAKKEGGMVDAIESHKSDFNVAAVVVPVLLLVLLAILLIVGFFCYKRKGFVIYTRKTKEMDKEPKEIIGMSPFYDSPSSTTENPELSSTSCPGPLSIENPCYNISDDDFDMYSEVKTPEQNETEPGMEKAAINPLYESTA